MPHSQRGFVAA